jgi:hypothetical protein
LLHTLFYVPEVLSSLEFSLLSAFPASLSLSGKAVECHLWRLLRFSKQLIDQLTQYRRIHIKIQAVTHSKDKKSSLHFMELILGACRWSTS